MTKSSLPVLISIALAVLLQTTSVHALCVKTKKANLRKGPSTNYQKLWQVFQYMPFKKLKTNKDWLRVQDLDGDVYWIHKKLVTSKFKCAVVKSNKTNLRTGPGTKYPKVPWSPVDKYFSVKVLKIKKKWVHIEDSVGDRGWIYRPLVWIQ